MAAQPPVHLAMQTLRAAAAARRDRLSLLLASAGIDALLIANDRDIRYLTAAPGHDAYLLIQPGGATLITDPRFETYLKPWSDQVGLALLIGVRHRLVDTLAPIVTERKIRRLGVQGEHLTLAACNRLAAALPDIHLIPTQGLVSGLRRKKDDVEVECIRRAIGIQHEALRSFLKEITPGVSELEAVGRLESHMRRLGGQGTSFPTMVLSAGASGLVHGVSSLEPIQADDVLLVDSGCVLHGYCSDVTRTVAIGESPEDIRELHTIVLEAHAAAIDACRPGASCIGVDRAARGVIEQAGYGDYFTHGVGHGIGLDIHEEPFLSPQSMSGVLEAGMVITIEPGIYVPDVGGARIEDDVLITDRGAELLTSFPRELSQTSWTASTERMAT